MVMDKRDRIWRLEEPKLSIDITNNEINDIECYKDICQIGLLLSN